MILAKVAYDASRQQFHLADPEMASMFKDGEVYLLFVDFLPQMVVQTESEADLHALMQLPVGTGHA